MLPCCDGEIKLYIICRNTTTVMREMRSAAERVYTGILRAKFHCNLQQTCNRRRLEPRTKEHRESHSEYALHICSKFKRKEECRENAADRRTSELLVARSADSRC